MDEYDVIQVTQELLWVALLLVGPSIAVSLIVGLSISIFQTVTSIQEQTLGFAPRILAVGITLCLSMSWSLNTLIDFTNRVFMRITEIPN